jgi:hypothetical protein
MEGFVKYAVEIGSGAGDIPTKVNTEWYRHSNVNNGIHREDADHISLLTCFKIGNVC